MRRFKLEYKTSYNNPNKVIVIMIEHLMIEAIHLHESPKKNVEDVSKNEGHTSPA